LWGALSERAAQYSAHYRGLSGTAVFADVMVPDSREKEFFAAVTTQ
jgi:hypothetical protein